MIFTILISNRPAPGKKKKGGGEYNLTPQTITFSSDGSPNYQGLHSGLSNYQNISIIPLPHVIFQLKKIQKIQKKISKKYQKIL
jgi:hypothetical protein